MFEIFVSEERNYIENYVFIFSTVSQKNINFYGFEIFCRRCAKVLQEEAILSADFAGLCILRTGKNYCNFAEKIAIIISFFQTG